MAAVGVTEGWLSSAGVLYSGVFFLLPGREEGALEPEPLRELFWLATELVRE